MVTAMAGAQIVPLPVRSARYGAAPEEWLHLSVMLGLTSDLLPVVSRSDATIAPESRMREIGKTPSRYNRLRQVVGFKDWTAHNSTAEEIEQWRGEPDLGICLQTRRVRALDVDVTDAALAKAIHEAIERHAGSLPRRYRSNSSKFLLAFILEGDYTKRIIKTTGGNIEFLATGQQCVVCGAHPSGARYEWDGGLPDEFPTLAAEQFEALWRELQAAYGVEPPSEARAPVRQQVLSQAQENDLVARALLERGAVLSTERDGRLNIVCPFADEHTSESGETSTVYWPAHTGGFPRGHFNCKHAHCASRSDFDFLARLGLADVNAVEFAPLAEEGEHEAGGDFTAVSDVAPATQEKPSRFICRPVGRGTTSRPGWIVKGILPKAALGVLYGESGCGKSFLAFDLAAAIAEGRDWCGRPVKRGLVVFIVAEGGGGFDDRVEAYRQETGAQLDDMVEIEDAPNFTKPDEVGAVLDSMRPLKRRPSLIVVDTLAQVTPGADENTGKDMGKVLDHCRRLHKATGAMVLLIHHSGKDETRGARGWSGLRAACDVEIKVERLNERRSATITKLKDGADGASFAFELHTVILGEDEDGEPLTSCVVEHTGSQRVRTAGAKKLGKTQQAVFDVIRERLDLQTGTIEKEMALAGYLESVEARPGVRDNRKRDFERVISDLVELGRLAVDGDHIRLPIREG